MTKVPTARLDKLLANLGYASRREIQLLAKNGRIRLDGVPLARADERIAVTPDLETRMVVDGEPLDPLPGFALMVHKPLGVTCSHKEA
ncbi:S4 domain-containing protein, partial [uncultured Aureimonas sp.]|uniref:S4 domain-containing protein n=1 Tax=uncultured Aureimonas sp. TaxID=1604662 RepID=UPI0025EE427C